MYKQQCHKQTATLTKQNRTIQQHKSIKGQTLQPHTAATARRKKTKLEEITEHLRSVPSIKTAKETRGNRLNKQTHIIIPSIKTAIENRGNEQNTNQITQNKTINSKDLSDPESQS